MPRLDRIATLPPEVRAELHRRLVARDFGDTVALSAWLAEQGFSVSKTTVGHYAIRNRDAIAQAVRLERLSASRAGRAMVDLRLRCAEAAAAACAGKPGALLSTAKALQDWVLTEPTSGAVRRPPGRPRKT
jgi:hypothetical protein